MQFHVDEVTDFKVGQYGPSTKIISGKDHIYVNDDARGYVGKTLEMEVEEKTSAKGHKYRIGKILKVIEAPAGAKANGHGVTWSEYEQMCRLAHSLAEALEPDAVAGAGNEEVPIITVDRSQARIRFVNNVMMAFKDGKVQLPEEEPLPFD